MLTTLRYWWKGTDHYEWFSGYMHARGADRAIRVMMGVITGALAACVLLLLSSPDSPESRIAIAAMWLAFLGGGSVALMWAWKWPSRTQSRASAILSNACVALACVSQPNALMAMMGLIAFATCGAYVAFFHTSKLVLYNFFIATAVGAFEALRLIWAGHVALGIVAFWLALQINIALPFAISWLVRALGLDLLRADCDPLTGLLNRRAFHQRVLGLIANRCVGDCFLVISLVDLDRFKAINDTYGHIEGDRTLVEVANTLRASSHAEAVIGRRGGEEFLIADLSYGSDHSSQARRMCDAIANLRVSITASVGTACAPLRRVDDDAYEAIVEHLISVADDAMYRVKRNGGNGVHHECGDSQVD